MMQVVFFLSGSTLFLSARLYGRVWWMRRKKKTEIYVFHCFKLIGRANFRGRLYVNPIKLLVLINVFHNWQILSLHCEHEHLLPQYGQHLN